MLTVRNPTQWMIDFEAAFGAWQNEMAYAVRHMKPWKHRRKKEGKCRSKAC